MKIAITDIYGKLYENDKIFDLNACNIGENLLAPVIELKNRLEKEGHEYHTLDMYSWDEIDKVIFQEVPDSIYTLASCKNKAKCILKYLLRKDRLYKAVKILKPKDRILLLMEPPAVARRSYDKKNHRFFGKILTWDDDLVDGRKYIKFFYPQPVPDKRVYLDFSEKKDLVMICGNKTSDHPDELYSARKKMIEYFEDKKYGFDLYGFGWESENYKNYKGSVKKKLITLSKYKYSICFENQHNVNGYITEKIFDCFFSNCVPVYWGAENIAEYIPNDTFIDWRQFSSIDEMIEFLKKIDEKEYDKYLDNIEKFLNSGKFYDYFSIEAYIRNMKKVILTS